MNMSISDLQYFSVSSFLDYMEDYVKLKKIGMSGKGEKEVKQEVFEGADGLDKFLGG